jgi:hypothetical protein
MNSLVITLQTIANEHSEADAQEEREWIKVEHVRFCLG